MGEIIIRQPQVERKSQLPETAQVGIGSSGAVLFPRSSLVKRGEALALLAPISNCEFRLKSPVLQSLSLLEVIHR
jgi:hypothetical protein